MNKFLIGAIILAIFVIFGIWWVDNGKKQTSFINPKIQTSAASIPTPSISPTVAPKTYKFDKSTDLKKELEDINPMILESDFR